MLALIALGGAALAADVNKAERVIAPVVVAAIILDRLIRRARTANWALATAAALGLVAVAAHDLLPGYARRFSLKRAAQVEPEAAQVADRISVPADALATGGDVVDAAIGRLGLQLLGGLT